MQINITKKTFIGIGIVLLMCIASFLAGRFIRFGGVSGTSQELVNGIILTGDEASRILDKLGIARSSGKSAKDLGYEVGRGIERLCQSDEVQRLFIDDIRREIETTTENAKVINESFTDVSDASDYGWDIILDEARALQRIAERTRAFDEDSVKNESKSE